MGSHFSRRNFLKLSALGALFTGSWLTGLRNVAIQGNKHPDRLESYALAAEKKSLNSPQERKFFTQHQYTMVATVAALIVPTDETPGATEVGVADYIDQLIAHSKARQRRYRNGLNWIDRLSEKKYDKGFLMLKEEDQIALLHTIEENEPRPRLSLSGFTGRVLRKISRIWTEKYGIGNLNNFFRTTRKHVFYGYFSSPIIWKEIGYFGPPQPDGYSDYSRPPSKVNYSGGIRKIDDRACQNCHFDYLHEKVTKSHNTCQDCHEPHSFCLNGE
jgi:hypothetical protein